MHFPPSLGAVGQPGPKGPHLPARGSAEIDSLRERIGFLIDDSGILRCPLGRPGVHLMAERAGWPGTGTLGAVFYDGPDMTREAASAADIAGRLGIPLERPRDSRPHPSGRDGMTGKCPRGLGTPGEERIQHAERALPHPERCRHTVWPVEVIAATEGDIGVAMEDLAMGRPHAADRLMAVSEQSRKLAQRERQWVKDRLVARHQAAGPSPEPTAGLIRPGRVCRALLVPGRLPVLQALRGASRSGMLAPGQGGSGEGHAGWRDRGRADPGASGRRCAGRGVLVAGPDGVRAAGAARPTSGSLLVDHRATSDGVYETGGGPLVQEGRSPLRAGRERATLVAARGGGRR